MANRRHMHGRFLFLGTGASAGVPMIGCECAVCRSSSSYNKRLRSSGLIRIKEKNFLIDVGPDFRAQALHYKINHLTGILLTHAHSDHIAGIDDLRAYYFLHKTKLPCVLSQETKGLNELANDYRMHAIVEDSFPRDTEIDQSPKKKNSISALWSKKISFLPISLLLQSTMN